LVTRSCTHTFPLGWILVRVTSAVTEGMSAWEQAVKAASAKQMVMVVVFTLGS